MEINLLDVGQTKYGDCILVRRGNRKILIDAAHPGDFDRIVAQLNKLLQQDPPHEFDLVVVTHCHADHIGCMPKLVSEEIITGKIALVADEKLGFGRTAADASPMDAVASPAARKVLAAIQEEPADDLDDAALAQFIEDAATLESTYKSMLKKLHADGTDVVRFGTSPDESVRDIESQFAEFGLKILGPTPRHLAICAKAISNAVSDAAAALSTAGPMADDAGSLVTAYRDAIQQLAEKGKAAFADAPLEDRPGVGAAKNDQSIVIRVEADGWRALLTGDMQFAEPEVTGLDSHMTQLLDDVIADGSYDFIKLAHHSSYNGIDDDVFEKWKETKLFAHTGGRRDPGHPDAGTLDLLQQHARSLKFARTDRNGIISVRKAGTKLQLIPERGDLNDFSKNSAPRARRDATAESTVQETETPVNSGKEAGDDEAVEVITRVPHVNTRVTVTIEVAPGEEKKNGVTRVKTGSGGPSNSGPEAAIGNGTNGDEERKSKGTSEGPVKLGGGRKIDERLLFVTRSAQLVDNIGKSEAATALKAITDAGQKLLDLPAAATTVAVASAAVRAELAANKYAGVVLVGGYDVVPSAILDVLDAKLRGTLTGLGMVDQDADGFRVWSDALYGDIDGDTVAELPVSRIPDGRKASVLLNALQAPAATRAARAGVHNMKRPFAPFVYNRISAKNDPVMRPSGPTAPALLVPPLDLSSDVYFMLHGSDHDATRFWGEQGGDIFEAVDLQNVPEKAPGAIVFCGCCWGALTVTPAAAKLRNGVDIRPRAPEGSIAISYLQAGALSFVGCTGTHYSPLNPVDGAGLDFFGKPMHDGFWAGINAGTRPAQALFDAKVKFAQGMPHGPDDPFSRAVEMKILREFTVLGLGW